MKILGFALTPSLGSYTFFVVKRILNLGLGVLLVVSTLACAHAQSFGNKPMPADIPVNPDLLMTPGELCAKGEANEIRYPEKIYYCNRNVGTDMKDAAFAVYDRKYGLKKKGYVRSMFKIDHLISLCMGGSNDITNLWPQHLTVSERTDRIENLICIMMSQGKMLQKQAVALILHAKMNLDEAPEIEARLIAETNKP